MSILSKRVLLLNASYEPIKTISARKAIEMLVAETADVVTETNHVIHSPSTRMIIPSIIALKQYVRIPYKSSLHVNRTNILKRDSHTCAYCGGFGDTMDHIHPKSKGGQHEWLNIVTSCETCNRKKGDKLLKDIGWSLRYQPTVPQSKHWMIYGLSPEPDWEPYLAQLNT